MKEYEAGAAGGPGADVPETGASKPGPAGGQGGSLWRQAWWAEGMAGAKALRQDHVPTSPGGRPAGLGRESRGRGGPGRMRPACRPPRGSAAASRGDGSQGQGEHSRADSQWQRPAGCCWRLGWERVGPGRPGPGRRRRPRAPRFSSRAGSSGLAPLPATFLHPSPGKRSLRKPCQRPPGKGPA